MRIDKIEIRNYRGFENESFALNPKFTVFIGDNAKGKTSVLDAIAISLGGFLKGIDVAQKEARNIRKKDIRIKTYNDDPKPQLPVIITATGLVLGMENLKWFRRIQNYSDNPTTVETNIIKDVSKEALIKSRSGEKITFPVLAYYGTSRLSAVNEIKKIPYEEKDEGVAIGYYQCLSSKSSATGFLSWYKTYEDEIRKFNLESDISLLEAFNTAIMSMIPGNQWVKMSYSFKDDDLIGLFLIEDDKYDKLTFSQLSDGFRNIIGIAADIAFRCIKLNPHLGFDAIKKTPGVVLIDEIDLHLHPNWQRQIVKDLKECFPNIQFVVTTHSPFIVQSLESSELINLDKVTDVNLKDLTIGEVAEEVMGTQSEMSEEHESEEDLSSKYLDVLKSIGSRQDQQQVIEELNNIELEISDPGVRALLKMKRLEKNI